MGKLHNQEIVLSLEEKEKLSKMEERIIAEITEELFKSCEKYKEVSLNLVFIRHFGIWKAIYVKFTYKQEGIDATGEIT